MSQNWVAGMVVGVIYLGMCVIALGVDLLHPHHDLIPDLRWWWNRLRRYWAIWRGGPVQVPRGARLQLNDGLVGVVKEPADALWEDLRALYKPSEALSLVDVYDSDGIPVGIMWISRNTVGELIVRQGEELAASSGLGELQARSAEPKRNAQEVS